jgi:hypothetical protein
VFFFIIQISGAASSKADLQDTHTLETRVSSCSQHAQRISCSRHCIIITLCAVRLFSPVCNVAHRDAAAAAAAADKAAAPSANV